MSTFIKSFSLASAVILAVIALYSCSESDLPSNPSKPSSGTESGPGDEGQGQDSDAPVAMASASAKEVGKFLASDKYIYVSTSAAQSAGAKVCGVVAYVGNDTGDATYRHGLAISMKNYNGNGSPWKNTYGVLDNPTQHNILSEALDAKESGYALTHMGDRTTNSYTWVAFYYAYWNTTGSDDHITITAPANTSGWFLPSIFQWNQVVNGLTGTEARLTTADNASLSMFYANEKLTALGAEGFKDGAYWSSSEYSENNAWLYWANYGKASDKAKNWNFYIRSVLAF